MARERVDAPPATPPRYSLLIAAPTIDDDGARWQAGVRFAPEGCGNSGRVPVECLGGTDLLDPDASPEVVTSDPFGVWAADVCSTIGYRARDFTGRARRQLEATQSFQIAAEVWTGSLNGDTILLGNGETIDNLELSDATSDTVTDGPTSPTGALGLLVGALGQCGQGRQGMIHVTPQVLTHLVAVSAIIQVGGSWFTPNGHLVVADDGYDGSGPGHVPATTSQWMYATSMMRIRLGAIEVIPDVSGDDADGNSVNWPAAVDPYTNLVTVFAQRLALVQFDRCCLIATEVNLAVPLIGGASSPAMPHDNPDATVRIVSENPDAEVTIVGGQVIESTPADVGKVVKVDAEGDLALETQGAGTGTVDTIVAGANITVDATDPANPIVASTGGGGGTVDAVVAGTAIDVDATDPANPVVRVEAATLTAISDAQSDADTAQATIDNHIADGTDAHDASAISVVPAGGIAATQAQAALEELDTEKAPKASPTFTGVATAPAFSSTGLTGAVSGARFVGCTPSVAPTTGTFIAGDYVVSLTGHIYVCTVGGSPGTWVDVTAGLPVFEDGVGTAVDAGTPGFLSVDVLAGDRQEFTTTSGTWTQPTNLAASSLVHIFMRGWGGPGGSGAVQATSTVRGAGGGGASANVVMVTVSAGDLPATVAVTIGAAPVPGAAVTADSTNGNPGVAGGDCTFGTIFAVSGGGPGLGGTSTDGGVGGTPGLRGMFPGQAGAKGAGIAAAESLASRGLLGTAAAQGTGGGGGGGASSAASGNGVLAGSDGGAANAYGTGVAGGIYLAGSDGGAGVGAAAGTLGSGGGGGARGNTTNAKNGGAGINGSGGGGGGGATNSFDSGAGGQGGSPLVRIICQR